MNTSQGSPQNYYRGDRWSPHWCSNTKIPLFLHLSAPPVANGVGTRSIGNKMIKLTSIHEGLSIGPPKKNPQGNHKTFLDIAVFLRKTFLKHFYVVGSSKYKHSRSHISMNMRDENPRKTQEVTSESK